MRKNAQGFPCSVFRLSRHATIQTTFFISRPAENLRNAHGFPGNTQTRSTGNKKWQKTLMPSRLTKSLPFRNRKAPASTGGDKQPPEAQDIPAAQTGQQEYTKTPSGKKSHGHRTVVRKRLPTGTSSKRIALPAVTLNRTKLSHNKVSPGFWVHR